MPRLSKDFAESKRPVQIYPTADLRRALVNFVEAQRLKPSVSDVGELALQEFLQREGFYPPPPQVESTQKKGKSK